MQSPKCHYYKEPEQFNLHPLVEKLMGWIFQPTRGECLWYSDSTPVWVETADNRIELKDCAHCQCYVPKEDDHLGI